MANKAVVVRGRDFALTFGYSGLAYFGELPTDNVIASHVLGTEVGPEAAPGYGTRDPDFHVQAIVGRLLHGIDEEYAKLPSRARAVPLLIAIAGVQKRRSRTVPIFWRIEKTPGQPAELIRTDLTGQPMAKKIYLDLVGRYEPADEAGLRSRLASVTSVRRVLDELAQAVVDTASKFPGLVGQDVVAVSFDGLAEQIEVEYRPISPPPPSVPSPKVTPENFATIDADDFIGSTGIVYSPWIITPGATIPAGVHGGGVTEFALGDGTSVRIIGPEDPSGRKTFMLAPQPRKGPPR